MRQRLPDTRGKTFMSKISQVFANNKAFIAYIMAGDPDLATTRENIVAIASAGADLIEIGIPFSDPVAEGEIIQQASLRALTAGTTLTAVLNMIESLKTAVTIPLVLMTYANPVLNYGYDRFFSRCQQVGISGIIIPDIPFEEQAEISDYTKQYQLDLISLIAPTSSERIACIAKAAQGFIYLVSSLGVTGLRNEIATNLPALITEIRRHTTVPIAVGFGIHTPEQAQSLAQTADGVIVGSAIVEIIGRHQTEAPDKVAEYVRQMKQALISAS